MNILVTAGNTQVPIDRVRCITNIFSGRTGARIALYCHERGHGTTLLTSHPEKVAELSASARSTDRFTVRPYRTFDDLQREMQQALAYGGVDALIHSAAVSDYHVAGAYTAAPDTRFHPGAGQWDTEGWLPTLVERTGDKLKSNDPELWLRLVRTPKLIDRVRTDWHFRGIVVKFKLEAGVSDEQLLTIAEESRKQSSADLMVANTLEGSASWAVFGPLGGRYERLGRMELAPRLVEAVERLHRERNRG